MERTPGPNNILV